MVPEAIEATTAELGRVGNASSLHTSGRQARRVLEESREQIAEAVGADAAEIVLTSGGTEADNLALQGAWLARRTERNRVVASAVEHPATLETLAALGSRGADAVELPVDAQGQVAAGDLEELVGDRTALVSVMWVNNETGAVQPVARVADVAAEAGAWSHSDAVQALGHLPVHFHDSGLDMMSLSAHKVGGPIGIGALVLKRGVGLAPVQFGGGQERDIRSGTAAPALAAGFAAAVRVATSRRQTESRRLAALRRRLVEGLGALSDDGSPGLRVNGPAAGPTAGEGVSPAIVNVSFPGSRADDVLLLLDAAGIDCSTGSACTAGVSQPSPVLMAMGRSEAQASESLRFSFGHGTTEADVDRLLAALPEAIHRARLAGGWNLTL